MGKVLGIIYHTIATRKARTKSQDIQKSQDIHGHPKLSPSEKPGHPKEKPGHPKLSPIEKKEKPGHPKSQDIQNFPRRKAGEKPGHPKLSPIELIQFHLGSYTFRIDKRQSD
jgi:hypothetical protein